MSETKTREQIPPSEISAAADFLYGRSCGSRDDRVTDPACAMIAVGAYNLRRIHGAAAAAEYLYMHGDSHAALAPDPLSVTALLVGDHQDTDDHAVGEASPFGELKSAPVKLPVWGWGLVLGFAVIGAVDLFRTLIGS